VRLEFNVTTLLQLHKLNYQWTGDDFE